MEWKEGAPQKNVPMLCWGAGADAQQQKCEQKEQDDRCSGGEGNWGVRQLLGG